MSPGWRWRRAVPFPAGQRATLLGPREHTPEEIASRGCGRGMSVACWCGTNWIPGTAGHLAGPECALDRKRAGPGGMDRSKAGEWTAFSLFFFFLFRAAPSTFGSSQARGRIGAAAAGLHHSRCNVGSKPRLQPTPQLRATQVLNPLSEARDGTQVLVNSSRVHNRLSHDGNSRTGFSCLP